MSYKVRLQRRSRESRGRQHLEPSREHANIRLGPRHDEGVDVFFREEGLKGACEKRGIARLVDNPRRRDEAREWRDNIESPWRQPRLRRAIPASEMPLPATRSVVGGHRRDKAGKHCARRIMRD